MQRYSEERLKESVGRLWICSGSELFSILSWCKVIPEFCMRKERKFLIHLLCEQNPCHFVYEMYLWYRKVRKLVTHNENMKMWKYISATGYTHSLSVKVKCTHENHIFRFHPKLVYISFPFYFLHFLSFSYSLLLPFYFFLSSLFCLLSNCFPSVMEQNEQR